MLFEMLAGVPAFDGKNLSQVLLRQMNDPVPTLRSVDVLLGHDGLDAFIRRACAKQPLERFQNMEEFVAALKGLQVSAWPSPRRKLVPGQDAPTAPHRPQLVPTAYTAYAYPSIADLDGDGYAEVIVGRAIFAHRDDRQNILP